jgi:hypothetical protein
MSKNPICMPACSMPHVGGVEKLADLLGVLLLPFVPLTSLLGIGRTIATGQSGIHQRSTGAGDPETLRRYS